MIIVFQILYGLAFGMLGFAAWRRVAEQPPPNLHRIGSLLHWWGLLVVLRLDGWLVLWVIPTSAGLWAGS